MSEKLHQHHEKGPEAVDIQEEAKRSQEHIDKAAEAAEKAHKPEHQADQARHKAAQEALSGKDVSVEHQAHSETNSFGLERNLKSKAYAKSLERIRSQLSPSERTFSKVIHNPTVDKTSNLVGKTVARPSGFLGGSICALLGSIILIYTSKHYGFRYNYLLFIILFAGGYVIGSFIELLVWLAASRRQRL
jgi:flagellar biosynthesis GTPase FlhF